MMELLVIKAISMILLLASKLSVVNAAIIILVFILYCIIFVFVLCWYFILLILK